MLKYLLMKEVLFMQDLWIIDVINKIADAMGVSVDIARPNDTCEFLMPTEDIPDESKVCLYDIIEYLTSDDRKMMYMSLAWNMPYYIEHTNISNVFRALARLELHYKGCTDSTILHYVEHNKYKRMDMRFRSHLQERQGTAPEITTILGLPVETFYNDEDNKIVSCLIELFSDETLRQKNFGGAFLLVSILNGNTPDSNNGMNLK